MPKMVMLYSTWVGEVEVDWETAFSAVNAAGTLISTVPKSGRVDLLENLTV